MNMQAFIYHHLNLFLKILSKEIDINFLNSDTSK